MVRIRGPASWGPAGLPHRRWLPQESCRPLPPFVAWAPRQPHSATDQAKPPGPPPAHHTPLPACLHPARLPHAPACSLAPRSPTAPPTTQNMASTRASAPPALFARTACPSRWVLGCVADCLALLWAAAAALPPTRLPPTPAAERLPPPLPLSCPWPQGEDTCWPVRTPIRYYLSAYGKVRLIGGWAAPGGGCAGGLPEPLRCGARRLRHAGAGAARSRSPPRYPAPCAVSAPQVEGPGQEAMMSEILHRGPITCSMATADLFDYGGWASSGFAFQCAALQCAVLQCAGHCGGLRACLGHTSLQRHRRPV